MMNRERNNSVNIGILTYHDSDNYGSVLQASALVSYINQLGYKAEIIDFRKPEVKEMYSIIRKPINKSVFASDIYSLLYYVSLRKRKKKFEEFRTKNMSLSKEINDISVLNAEDYTTFVVGSDQVWNIKLLDFDLAYMLPFPDKRKIAYAASFGVGNIDVKEIENYTEYIQSFSEISVRESDMVQTLSAMNISSVAVCDPVFLMDKEYWLRLANDCDVHINSRYCLCYFPGYSVHDMEQFSMEVSQNNSVKRVLIMPEWKNLFRNGKKQYDVGPNDFIKLINESEFVCSSSFHGTALSLILGKGVYAYFSSKDNRINELMEMFEGEVVEKNIVYFKPQTITNDMNRRIDFSKSFLAKALSEA